MTAKRGTTPSNDQEKRIVWSGHPSQILNLHWFILAGMVLLLASIFQVAFLSQFNLPQGVYPLYWGLACLPVLWAGWQYLCVTCHHVEMTDERLVVKRGVLNRTTNQVELFRVRDFELEEPILLRLFGLSNLLVLSSDRTTPRTAIPAVHHGAEMMNEFRHVVRECWARNGVRELDMG